MLPALDPAETVFGWGCKTRLLLGISARQLSLKTFGSSRAGQSSDLPPSLANLERRGGVCLGEPATLVRRHTIFGSYLTLAEPGRSAEAQDALFNGRMQTGRMLLGLQSNRLGSRHPLRFCKTCAEEDRQRLGYPRWLIDHQLPGAWICTAHKELLVELKSLSHPWQLPLEGCELVEERTPGADVRHALEIAAKIAAELIRLEMALPEQLRQVVLARMVDLGIVQNPARLNSMVIQRSFMGSAVARFAGAREELVGALSNPEWLVALVRSRHATHPLKWAICWAWLWESEQAATAVAAFRRAAQGSYEPNDSIQLSLWRSGGDVGAELAVTRVHEAMESVQTLEELASRMRITGGVLRSWMALHAGLRSAWAERIEKYRLTRAKAVLSAAVNLKQWSGRAQFVHRYRSLVGFLRGRDAVSLEVILAQIPVYRSKQRRLF